MNTRKAKEEDIESIFYVINESNRDAYSEIIPEEIFEDPILPLNDLKKIFREMTFYVCTEENEIVGVAALSIENKEVGKVRWVHVLPEYRKQGIGTNLMRHIEEKAKRKGVEKLAVQYVHNKAYWARNFYSDLGYKKEREVSHPQGQCFIYEKKIEENKPPKTS